MPITRAGLVGPRGVSTERLWSTLLPRTTVPSATATDSESHEASSKRAPAAIAGRIKTSRKKEREPSHRALTAGPAIAPECRFRTIRRASNPTQVEDEIARFATLLRRLFYLPSRRSPRIAGFFRLPETSAR